MARLLLLFILVPIAELALLIEIGEVVGLPATLGLIVVTGALGAWLARRQGLGILARVKKETAEGRLPAGQVIDGVIVLIAGAVLMTPGVLTDLFGFFCLIPAARGWLKNLLKRRIEGAIERGNLRMTVDMGGAGPAAEPMRDVTPRTSSADRLPGSDDPLN